MQLTSPAGSPLECENSWRSVIARLSAGAFGSQRPIGSSQRIRPRSTSRASTAPDSHLLAEAIGTRRVSE